MRLHNCLWRRKYNLVQMKWKIEFNDYKKKILITIVVIIISMTLLHTVYEKKATAI